MAGHIPAGPGHSLIIKAVSNVNAICRQDSALVPLSGRGLNLKIHTEVSIYSVNLPLFPSML